MSNNTQSSFMTVLEILRTVTNALDIKNTYDSKLGKKLDTLIQNKDIDPRTLNQLIDNFFEPLATKVGTIFHDTTKSHLLSFLEKYRILVREITVDGTDRSEHQEIIYKHLIAPCFTEYLIDITQNLPGANPSVLLESESNAVRCVIEWAKTYPNTWSNYYKSLQKEQKDRIAVWCKDSGNELPLLSSIVMHGNELEKAGADVKFIETLTTYLCLARFIEYFKNISGDLSNTKRLLQYTQNRLWNFTKGVEKNWLINIENSIWEIQLKKLSDTPQQTLTLLEQIQFGLMRTAPKTPDDKERFKILLDQLRNNLPLIPFETTYWVDWHEARWFTYSGDLNNAVDFYKKAFEGCLYCGGTNHKLIIEESLVVGSSIKRPDKPFLRKLKWAGIFLDIDLPSVDTKKPSSKFEDSIEDWELKSWKAHFDLMFPTEGRFSEKTNKSLHPRIGGLIISEYDLKPDLKNPDRKINVGDGWKKRMPQLNWFINNKDFDAVSALLKAGASVNCTSDTDDTPLLIATELLSADNIFEKSFDRRFFDLICEYQHDKSTVNKRTQKKRLLPLISAVKSGQPDIVEKLLEMGANPNQRGETDEQTPLNVALKYLSILKKPGTINELFKQSLSDPHVLDSIRRHTNTGFGFTLEQTENNLSQALNGPLYNECLDATIEQFHSKFFKQLNATSMTKIAKLLIQAGADVNAEHKSPLKGYTPLMLAAELDFGELFSMMLENGGDAYKTYINSQDGSEVNCVRIAHCFKSHAVSKRLRTLVR